MMEKCLVTAIITTHNRSSLLERAIQSVFAQTYSNIELIVVDDASTDNTLEICKKYNLRYIKIPIDESRGGNYARNLGIKNASGELVAFLDDDDYWLPEKIEKQVNNVRDSKSDISYCPRKLEIVSKNGIVYRIEKIDENAKGDLCKFIMYTIPCTTSSLLIKKNLLFEAGLFDENLRFWQEYELLIRIAQKGIFSFVGEHLLVYRINRCDTSRLTNKYFAWKKAVAYINDKHRELYLRLNKKEKKKYKMLVTADSVQRCKNSRLYFRYIFFRMKYLLQYITNKR